MPRLLDIMDNLLHHVRAAIGTNHCISGKLFNLRSGEELSKSFRRAIVVEMLINIEETFQCRLTRLIKQIEKLSESQDLEILLQTG